MRIAIDARWITKESSGIGQYTTNLIRYLSKHSNHSNTYFLIFSKREIFEKLSLELNLKEKENFKPIFISYDVFSFLGQIKLPFLLNRMKIDLFHSTNFMIPLFSLKTKVVATIHDLIPFLFPEYAPRSKKSRFYFFYSFLMQCIIKKVNHIFVDSKNSYNDLIQNFKKADKKTSILTFGIDPSFNSQETSQPQFSIQKKLSLEGPFILYVGRQDPYKNLIHLVKVFKELSKDFDNLSLVIAGSRDERYPELWQTISALKLDSKVILTGFLSQNDLVHLYKKASVLALPSRYEGFGLPLLEAMSCGVPVVASNAASIPEIVGDAGILLDADDVGKWVESISCLLKDESLRLKLIEKGYQRLSLFNWEKTIEQLLLEYEKICQR